jgi:hypothetical protein
VPIEAQSDVVTQQQRLFNVQDAVGYLRSIGATSATVTFVRNLINSGQVPHIRISKRFYVTRAAMDAWLSHHERRAR